MEMEDQYSRQFFTMFVEGLQSSCKNFLKFNRFVEISGYVSVEIDNVKKERYVLSELLQSSGNVVSESFCTKVLTIDDSECNPQIPSNQNTSLYQYPRQRNRRKPSRTFPSQRLERASTCTSKSVFLGTYGVPASESMMLPVSPASETVPESSLSSPVDVEQSNSESFCGRKRSASQSVFNISQFKLHRPGSSTTSYSEAPDSYPEAPDSYSEAPDSYSEAPDEDNIISLQHGTGTSPKEMQSSIQTESLQFQDSVSSQDQMSEFESKFKIEQNTDMKPIAELQVSFPRTVSQTDHDSGQQAFQIGARLECQDRSGTGGDADDEVIDLDMSDSDVSDPSHSSFEKNISRDLNPVIGLSTFDSSPMQTPPNTNPGSFGVMKSVVKRFVTYHLDKSGESVDIMNTSPEKLNALLLDFYQGAKKADGTGLQGGSLRNIQVYLERYLKEAGYPYSLVKDDEFLTSREYVRSKFIRMKGPTKHVPIDEDDIKIMFEKKVLGGHSPDALFHTLWFMNCRYFARKKPGEHFNMKWGEISLKMSDDGKEYLERPIYASFSLKLFANLEAPNRCFVNLYKQYRDVRPRHTLDSEFPFYLKQIKVPSEHIEDRWFLDHPMPWSPFTSVWKKMVFSAGLPLNKRIL